MRSWTVPLALAAGLLAAVPVHAFPIGDEGYSATEPFAPGFGGIATFLSGSLEADAAAAHGPFVALNTTGFRLSGLTKVCWTNPLPDCVQSGSGALVATVPTGASVGLQFPANVKAHLSARHAIALFVDEPQSVQFQGLKVNLNRTFATIDVGGQLALGPIAAMPDTPVQNLNAGDAAGLALLGSGTITVSGGALGPRNLSGDKLALTFQGKPVLPAFGAEVLTVPFTVGSTARFAQADAAAAQEGMDLARVARRVAQLSSSFGGSGGDPGDSMGAALQPVQPLLGAVLDGALLSLPTSAPSASTKGSSSSSGPGKGDIAQLVANVTLLRFSSLEASPTANGSAVQLEGQGPLQIQGGRVVGAPSLLGLLPWWCWLLWVAAIGMWVARLVAKPPKQSETWDRLRWVGWVAGPVVALLVFWLWDGQVHRVWGLSLLGGGATGAGLPFLMVVEVAIGLVIYVAAVTPTSSLLKSGFRFAKLGRFMGLHRPIAMLIGFLFGTTLLLSYLDFIMRLVAH